MLLPTHIAGAYCATEAALFLLRRPRSEVCRGPILYGVVAGVVSDLDLVPLFFKLGWKFLGGEAGQHRESILHTLIFAVVLALVPVFLRMRERSAWAVAGCVGLISHLVLDSLTIGWGIMWFYPFSIKFYGINIATRWYGAQWGDKWLSKYIWHPLFIIELAIMSAGFVVARLRTSARNSDCKTLVGDVDYQTMPETVPDRLRLY